ncbi:uncharacterized protein (DUF1501 family) [Variovorax paradoxus]|uniref:Uncharacterized protein (DUF1501 family) n=1 Tax=Variovorax paradoxus TaxID=34073 RepID=A0AAE3Y2U8_VARPD|nr:DUF1501 domain-containing protein [Variovorax paradoxus]MDP9965265.1 uncharacterized protein (DUF1501 family) [Variovorax paradoxus]MDR6428301.1 uncharacterized protein (DUF1501 family) [Variovorax paradoxus]
MQRRELLKLLAGAPLAGAVGRLVAAPAAEGTKLLVVFLRGAYDCANLLVPTGSDFYYASRPNIAIARPGSPNGALPLDADWGLHPALAQSVMPMFQQKQASFIAFAGTDDLTRSHFETQDSIELGQALDKRRDYRSGFLNRLAGVLGAGPVTDVSPIAFTDQLPISMRGSAKAANMALAGSARSGIDARQSQVIAAMYRNTTLAQPVAEGFQVRDEVMRAVQAEMDAASRNAMSAKGFELVARRMALLMRDRFDLGFVDVGGWDTHVGQGGATGYLANRFEELGRGVAGFAQEMGDDAWRQTVVVVISEFGRTFRENGNRGTDHGHGTVYWVLGGGLSAQAGGRIVGEQQEVAQATLFQNRDYPVLNEYRAVFGGLFKRMYGLSPAQLARVFEGVAPKDLQLV